MTQGVERVKQRDPWMTQGDGQMKYRVTVIILLLAVVTTGAVQAQGLMTESDRGFYRGLLEERRRDYPGLEASVFSVLAQAKTADETDALLFLLSTSPLSDLADNSGDFFLSAVRTAFETRRTTSWGKSIPDPVFLHFVLPLRTGSEAVDSSRLLFPAMLLPRVRPLDMRAAVLEVNHWCHERVTYAPSDARTRAPLVTIRNAKGRCGEESVFTTTALRAAGIPARQVYVPRWAHADDNHAWVEAWVDGQWHFLGACEPDVDLDRAWFTEPARRAMLTAATAQGRYAYADDILSASRLFTRINTLPVYAPTRTVNVQVIDEFGRAATSARVDFCIYNYAEFFPIASANTDGSGHASLRTGRGDLLVWAHDGARYAFAPFSRERGDTLRLVLSDRVRTDGRIELDLVPPPEVKVPQDEHPRAAETAAKSRLGDSLRALYETTFPDSARTAAFADVNGYPADSCWMLLREARGNGGEILSFLERVRSVDRINALAFLRTLAVKDLQDAPADILLAHYREAMAQRPAVGRLDALQLEYVVCPRIGREELRPWRMPLHAAIAAHPVLGSAGTDEDRARRFAVWVRDSIRLDATANWGGVPLPVLQCFSLRGGDEYSRNLLFVALCRCAGIAARLNPATAAPEFHAAGQWYNAGLRNEEVRPLERAELVRHPRAGQRIQSPEYGRHFTLARFDNGMYHTLDYEGSPLFASWPARLRLQEGKYMIVTGNRQPDGSVLAAMDFFLLRDGETGIHELNIRDDDSRPAPLARIAPGLLPKQSTAAGSTAKDSSFAFILLWIERGTEPVSHVLLDLAAERAALGAQTLGAQPVSFHIAGRGMSDADLAAVAATSLPAGTSVLPGNATGLRDEIAAALHLPAGFELPLLAVCTAEGEIMYASRGYTIGVGTQVLRILERLRPAE